MKTPEELAVRYSDLREFADRRLDYKAKLLLEQGFLAGYQAAQDQFADTSKVMNSPEKLDSSNQTNLPTPAKWVLVKERLPEFCKTIVAYGPRIYCVISQLMQDEEGHSYVGPYMSVHPDEVTHWMPLPEPPKEEKQ